MNFVLLAAGFGTRLMRDIANDESGEFAHLHGYSKALVPIDSDGGCVASWWYAAIAECVSGESQLHKTVLITNSLHVEQFRRWAERVAFDGQLIDNGASDNATRLGAIGDIQRALGSIEDAGVRPTMIIASDTLFHADFQLSEVMERFAALRRDKYSSGEPFALILCYELADHGEVAKRGVIELLDDTDQVASFLEKPAPADTASNKAVPAFYVYSAACMALLDQFIAATPEMKDRDAPGRFLQWLFANPQLGVAIHAKAISGRYDIGGLQDYRAAMQSLAAN